MADDFKRAQRAAVLERSSTVLAGLLFCAVTIWGAQAERSLGILSVTLVLITATGLVHAFVPRNTEAQSKARNTLLTLAFALVFCVVSVFLLARAQVMSGAFILCILALCHISAPFARAGRFGHTSGLARIFLVSGGMVMGLSYFAPLNLNTVLLILCLASVCTVLHDLSFDRPVPTLCESRFNARLVCGRSGGIALLCGADIVAALAILPPDQSLIYCGARLWVMLAKSTLQGFERLVAPAVTEAYYDAPRAMFVGTMARVNLSLFLIGAAACVLVLATSQNILLGVFHLSAHSETVMTYLLIGVFVPAALGVMDTTSKILVPPQFSAGFALCAMGVGSAVYMGQATASAQALALAYCFWRCTNAVLHGGYWGAKHSVFPGPTALLARQIRLLR